MRYLKKVTEVEVEQYFAGKPCPGVTEFGLEIQWSLDKTSYYIIGTQEMPCFWLSDPKVIGPVPPEKQKPGFFDPTPVCFTKMDARYWHRFMFHFSTWKVKEGVREKISKEDDLVLDYGAASKWKKLTLAAYVTTIHGQKTTIADGDWIVQEPDGIHYYPVKDAIFKENYVCK